MGYEHDGYVYLSNKATAEKLQKKSNNEMLSENDDGEENQSFTPDNVECIEFETTKTGILAMLNGHCDICDNG